MLGVPYHKLKEFEKDRVGDPLTSIFHYLLSNGTAENTPLTWMHVVVALKSDHVGEPGLATCINDKFCKGKISIATETADTN